MRNPRYLTLAALSLLSLNSCGTDSDSGQVSQDTGVAPTTPVAPTEPPASGSRSDTATQAKASNHPVISVSRETTWVLEPLDDRGRIDFIAALNRGKQPVKAEENAALALVEVLGSGFEDEGFHQEFVLQIGGAQNLLMQTESLLEQSVYADKHRIEPPDKFFDQCAEASSRPWTAAEFPQVHRWLQSCESDMDACVDALRRPQYYYPLVDSLDEETSKFCSPLTGVLLPLPQKCRGVARALTARAMQRTGEGNIQGAREDVLAVFCLGRFVGQGPTLIECLVGIAIESIAQECAIELLNSGRLDVAATSTLEADLVALPPPTTVKEKVRLGERLTALDLAIAMADHGPGVLSMISNISLPDQQMDASSIDWDTTLRTINQWYDRLEIAIGKPTFSERVAAVESLNESLNRAAKSEVLELVRIFQGASGDATASGKRLGDFISALTVPGCGPPHVAETRLRSRRNLLMLAIRLHQHRLRNGDFPESLPAAEGKQLVDLYTEEQLVYRLGSDACKLYSRGPNQRDDGGPARIDGATSDDVGFELVQTN
ncbi:MAG: hypothetical protein WD049_01135 [Candidatus Paceibacterota bacterium]